MANFWRLDEENAFFTGVQCSKILYDTNLNVIIIISTSNEIVVVDVTSGAELHRSRLSGDPYFILPTKCSLTSTFTSVRSMLTVNFDLPLTPFTRSFHNQQS